MVANLNFMWHCSIFRLKRLGTAQKWKILQFILQSINFKEKPKVLLNYETNVEYFLYKVLRTFTQGVSF